MDVGSRVQVYLAQRGGVQWVGGTVTRIVGQHNILARQRTTRYEVRMDDGTVLHRCHPSSIRGAVCAVLS